MTYEEKAWEFIDAFMNFDGVRTESEGGEMYADEETDCNGNSCD